MYDPAMDGSGMTDASMYVPPAGDNSIETLSAAEIQANYNAALDSVTLINDLMALSSRDDEQTATVARNVEHLEIMVAKTYWTDAQDLSPLHAAIAIGSGTPVADASGGMTDASGMASGPSCFTIEFNDGSLLKEGQTVFVSYDGGGWLVDSNENSINSFSQIVNNSSTVYNDETAPTLMAAPMPSLNADGQTISLQFSESIDQSSVYNALQNFKLFVDGVEQTGSFSLESDASGGTTDASMYDPAMDGSGMTDGSAYDPLSLIHI